MGVEKALILVRISKARSLVAYQVVLLVTYHKDRLHGLLLLVDNCDFHFNYDT